MTWHIIQNLETFESSFFWTCTGFPWQSKNVKYQGIFEELILGLAEYNYISKLKWA